ncbi:hypothetical protein Tco_1343118 [Tanacetum coccineum]
MNSMFSSFDALSAEFLSKSLRAFNTKAPLKDEQTKVKHETSGSTVIRSSNKASSYGARWAPELDGLHCFEFMVRDHCFPGTKHLLLAPSEFIESPAQGSKTPLTLSWERIPRLDSGVRASDPVGFPCLSAQDKADITGIRPYP